MEILEVYKRECPELFARLPLPKDIAEKMGCPITDEIIPLSAYLKKHNALRVGAIDSIEEKMSCTITPASEAKLPEPETLEIKALPNVTETPLNSRQVPEKPTTPESSS